MGLLSFWASAPCKAPRGPGMSLLYTLCLWQPLWTLVQGLTTSPLALRFCWFSSTFQMPYRVPDFRAPNRTGPYLHKPLVWSWKRPPAGKCAQPGRLVLR